MKKICNLSTVKNTPSEAWWKIAVVDYYFINFHDDTFDDIVPRWHSIGAVIEGIWNLLETEDLYFIGDLYICAYMSDGSIRRVRHIDIDKAERHVRISRVK